MGKCFKYFTVLSIVCLAFIFTASAQETYTGTVVSYGSGFRTGTTTNTFTLRITGNTSDDNANHFLSVLQNSGQDDLLSAIKNQNVGTFSVGANIGRTLNVVREDTVDGKRHILAVFERWMQFGELRGGYRSVDYPFGYIELFIDPRTGKGDGTYIAAAKIRWTRDKKANQYQVEVENFATYPSRLMGVTRRGRRG